MKDDLRVRAMAAMKTAREASKETLLTVQMFGLHNWIDAVTLYSAAADEQSDVWEKQKCLEHAREAARLASLSCDRVGKVLTSRINKLKGSPR